MNFVGDINGKSKKECAVTKKRMTVTLPTKKNGFIYTGDCDEYDNTLVAFDFDKDDLLDEIDLTQPFFKETLENTMMVKTGGGGIHIIVQVEGKHSDIVNIQGNPAKNIKNEIREMGFKQVDLRGHNGKLFTAGTKFPEHKGGTYELLNDLPPLLITRKEFDDMFNTVYLPPKKLTKEEKELNALRSTKPSLKKTKTLDLIEVLAKSPLFYDDGSTHTRHGELVSIAIMLMNYDVNEEDCIDIIKGIEEIVKTKEGGPDAEKIVTDVFAKGYSAHKAIFGDPKNGIKGIKDLLSVQRFKGTKGWKAKRTWWKDFTDILDEVSTEFHKLLKKAEEAASKAKQKVLEKKDEEEFIDDILTTFIKKPIFYIDEWKEFATYKNGVYVVNDLILRNDIRNFLEKYMSRLEANKYIGKIMMVIMDKKHISFEAFDKDKYLINFKNGLYCTLTHTFQTHDPEYLSLIQSPTCYHEKQSKIPTQFNKFTTSLTHNKIEKKRFEYILKAIIENKLNERKKYVVFHGKKDAGKGITFRLIQNILGKDNTLATSFHDLGERFSGGNMISKRFVYDSDASAKTISLNAISFLKKITGMDMLHMEKKGKDMINAECTFSFGFACNRIPQMPSNDELGSFTERAIYFYFDIQHKNDESTRNFEAALMHEKDKIVSYLLNLPEMEIEPLPFMCDIKDAKGYWKCKSNPAYEYIRNKITSGSSMYDAQDIVRKLRMVSIQKGIHLSNKVLWDTLRTEIEKCGGDIWRKQIDGVKRQFTRNVNIESFPTIAIVNDSIQEISESEQKTYEALLA